MVVTLLYSAILPGFAGVLSHPLRHFSPPNTCEPNVHKFRGSKLGYSLWFGHGFSYVAIGPRREPNWKIQGVSLDLIFDHCHVFFVNTPDSDHHLLRLHYLGYRLGIYLDAQSNDTGAGHFYASLWNWRRTGTDRLLYGYSWSNS